ncbi:MAG TPA: TonB-dependent receptor, partial [Polymorphobacter sp.]|nr:TonB-dependent receptor [Polymorphobacter sp.]
TNKGLELEIIGRPFANLVLTTSVGYQNASYGLGGSTADFNAFGAKSLSRQQRDCQAQLAAGMIPLGSGASNAADCARGVVDANGDLATPANTPAWTVAIGGTYNFAIPTAGIVLSPTVNLAYRSGIETGAANATLYTGAVTSAFNGQVYPANPFGGDVISGSYDGSAVLVSAQLAMETDDGNWLVALACDNCFDTAATTASTGNWSYLQAPMTWTIRAKRSF